jgi:hypothetical protein
MQHLNPGRLLQLIPNEAAARSHGMGAMVIPANCPIAFEWALLALRGSVAPTEQVLAEAG